MGPYFARLRTTLSALLLLIVLVCSQLLAASVAPEQDGYTGQRAVGRAGFAYLGGLRTFVAAVLWNRIDPLLHGYYDGVPLDDQTYMIPTLRLITALDPQFERAYSLAVWLVFKRVGETEGIDLARRSVAENPRSGMLWTGLAQALLFHGEEADEEEMREAAEFIVSDRAVWLDDYSRFEGYAAAALVFKRVGMPEERAKALAELENMRLSDAEVGDHDHDGDGEQDH